MVALMATDCMTCIDANRLRHLGRQSIIFEQVQADMNAPEVLEATILDARRSATREVCKGSC